MTERTRSAPSASTAIAAQTAESIPPESPRITPGEAVLLDVVAQTQHAGLPVGGSEERKFGARRFDTAPAAFAPLPARKRHARLELRHLEGERAVGVQAKGAAVEDKLVLPAHLIGEDQRQSALDDAGDRDLHALIRLVAPVGRAVRHDQDFGAGLRQALADLREPDVLADRDADPDAAKVDRAREALPA